MQKHSSHFQHNAFWGRFLTLTIALLLLHSARTMAAENTISVSVWSWQGEKDNRWFESGNWRSGDLFSAPTTDLPVAFGPVQLVVNGFPTDTYFFPVRGAVLDANFSSPKLTMRSFDGPAILTIENGATYSVAAAVVGKTAGGDYVPAGIVQPATLNLCNGYIAGSWVIGEDASAVLNICGAARAATLALATSAGVTATINIASGATFATESGVTVGAGTVVVNNSAQFLQNGNWSGGISRWHNLPLSSLVVSSMEFKNSIVNESLITFAGGVGQSHLKLIGGVALAGGGELVFRDANSVLGADAAGGVLTNVDNLIHGGGGGQINVKLVNQHIVRADSGQLNILVPMDNTEGLVEVKNGARLDLNHTALSGLIDIEPGGTIQNGVLQNVIHGGTLTVAHSGIALQDSMTNRGLITFGTGLFADTPLNIIGAVRLTGGGEVVVEGGLSLIRGDSESSGLINVDNLIRVRRNGRITLPVINQKVVRAEDGFVSLTATMDNSAGRVEVKSGATLNLHSTTLNGIVDIEPGGIVQNGVLSNVLNPGTLTVISPGIALQDNLTNRGLITFGTGFADAPLNIIGLVRLTGGGEVVVEGGLSLIRGDSAGSGLINVDNLIRVRRNGRITLPVINQKVVRAEDGFVSLTATMDNSAGRVEVKNGATLNLHSTSLNGIVDIEPGGIVQNGVLSNVVNSGTLTVISPGIALQDNLTNRGLITFGTGFADAPLNIIGLVRLTGGGEVVVEGGLSLIRGDSAGSGLINVDNLIRVRRNGRITLPVINQKVVRAEDGFVSLTATMDNSAGRVEVKNGATLNLHSTTLNGIVDIEPGGIVQNGVLSNVVNSGTLTVTQAGIGLQDSVTNRGQITFASGPFETQLDILGTVRLTGGGAMILPRGLTRMRAASDSSVLHNEDNTIRGAGRIDVALANAGTIVADSGTLTLSKPLESLPGAQYGAERDSELEVADGTGILTLPAGTTVFGDGRIDATLITAGEVSPGRSIGTLTIERDAAINGTLRCELDGASNDRLAVGGQLGITGGTLDLQILSGKATLPVYVIASYGSLTGVAFENILHLPAGYAIDYAYEGSKIALVKRNSTPYQQWAAASKLTEGLNAGVWDDPNRDGRSNIEHFAFDTDPLHEGGSEAKIRVEIAEDGTEEYLTLTLPIRAEAVFSEGPAPAATVDGLIYTLLGDENLQGHDLGITARIVRASELPLLRDMDGDGIADWEYRTFRLTSAASTRLPMGFITVQVKPE